MKKRIVLATVALATLGMSMNMLAGIIGTTRKIKQFETDYKSSKKDLTNIKKTQIFAQKAEDCEREANTAHNIIISIKNKKVTTKTLTASIDYMLEIDSSIATAQQKNTLKNLNKQISNMIKAFGNIRTAYSDIIQFNKLSKKKWSKKKIKTARIKIEKKLTEASDQLEQASEELEKIEPKMKSLHSEIAKEWLATMYM